MLATKPISNIHRSPDQWDGIEIQILASTPLEKISILKDRIHNYIVRLPQIWYPRWRLVVKEIEDSNRLKLYMTVQHHINFQVDAQSSLIWCIYVNPVRDIMIYNSSFMLLLEDPPPWHLSFSLTRISRIQHAPCWHVHERVLKITSITLKLKSNISTH